jgi:hypothetical protein
LQRASNSARNDDIAKTNGLIVDYLIPANEDMLAYNREEFPLPDKIHYEERGWNHPQYTYLLYPMALRDHLHSDDIK